MTHTQQFIEDAVKGGWIVENLRFNGSLMFENEFSFKGETHISGMLLDPDAWRAVGKTRGWTRTMVGKFSDLPFDDETLKTVEVEEYRYKQHQFIDHLNDGLSIEEALGKL